LPGALGTIANVGIAARDQTTNITILQSEPILSQGLERLNQSGRFPPLEIDQVRRNLTIQPVQNSDIITITYKDSNPERAAALLNELEKVYLQFSLNERTAQARNSLQLIESQLPVLEQRLAASSQQLEDFRRQYGFPDPDAYAAALATTRTTFERNLRDADIQINQLRQQQQAIAEQIRASGGDPQDPIASTILSQNPEYIRLVGQLQQTEAQLALERLRFQEDSPPIQRLVATREQLLSLIEQQIISSLGQGRVMTPSQVAAASVPLLSDSLLSGPTAGNFDTPAELAEEIQTQQEIQEVTALSRATALQQTLTSQLLSAQVNAAVQEARRSATEAAIQATLQAFDQLPPLQRRYAELVRQVNLDSAAITTLLQRRQDLQIAQAQEIPPWRVVETATVPIEPVSPNVRRNIIFAFLAGAVLGVGVAVFVENLDPRVKTLAEARSATKLPPLGIIPRLPVSRQGAKPRTLSTFGPIVEAFRSLAFTVIYGGKSLHTLAVTSALPGEGKSTTSHQFALALAEFGKNILLIDADLRCPTQHEILGIPNALGLSSVLTGERLWQDLVYTHPKQPKLDVLVAGPQPINPLLLLGSPLMQELLQEWQKAYDFVVVDTPPLTGIADTQAVAKQVDTTLLVVGLGTANFNAIAQTLETLRRNGADLLGMVVNFVDRDESGYSYYNKYYQQSQPPAISGSQKRS
ncbi:MAG: polysaccharide biosynthesis tyrosine autokinase, partial [Thermostichales cyanobacterium HHBFW_bins_127]